MIREIKTTDLGIINSLLKELDDFEVTESGIINHPFSKIVVYELDGQVVALLHYSIIYDKVEIDYIVVLEQYQRRGIATKLLNYLVDIAISDKCTNITLEVKISNKKAISLYKKLLFKEVTIRKNYYKGEDAVLLLRELVF